MRGRGLQVPVGGRGELKWGGHAAGERPAGASCRRAVAGLSGAQQQQREVRLRRSAGLALGREVWGGGGGGVAPF